MFVSHSLPRSLTAFAFSLLTVFFLLGCDSIGNGEAGNEPEGEGVELAASDTSGGLHQDFEQIASEIPDFGGFYLDEEGNPTVYLLDPAPSRKDEVRSVLEETFGEDIFSLADEPRRSEEPPELQLREGIYSMEELLAWYERLPEVLTADGAIMVDLHERENNLTVGVETREAADRVEERLRELEIPREAVEIIEKEVPTPHGHGLRSRFRPTEGGIQIGQVGSSVGCTLGFAVNYRGTHGFITNSHCTGQLGNVTGTRFGNPGGGSPIGQESADPNFSTCYFAFSCRKSDAAFVDYNSGTRGTRKIAQPRNWAGPSSNSSTLKISHSSSSLDIRGMDSYPVSGQMLDKVGRTTGWTWGYVNRTNFMTFQKGASANGKRVLFRHQYQASFNSGPGDSGSPVFDWHGNEVTVVGVLWGGSSGNAVFSPWGGIKKDF